MDAHVYMVNLIDVHFVFMEGDSSVSFVTVSSQAVIKLIECREKKTTIKQITINTHSIYKTISNKMCVC